MGERGKGLGDRMQDFHIGVIGIIAGICTTVSFIPQIVKIVRTGHVRDISLYMYIVLTAGIFMWLVYGILIGELPIILANSVSVLLCSFVIFKKVSGGGNGR